MAVSTGSRLYTGLPAGAKQEKVHTRRGDRVEAGTPRSVSWLEESSEARKPMKVYSEEGRKAKKVTFSLLLETLS